VNTGERAEATVRRARSLRKAASDVENRLWYVLRNRNLDGLKFVRQAPIGPYFADFLCAEAGLIVELDGGQHADSSADLRRTAFLNHEGYSVLRFWNNEVNSNRDAVLQAILDTVAGNPSPDLRFAQATLSPTGRGTRGARAARAAVAARHLSEAPSVPLPVGERVDRPKAETGEGFQGTLEGMP
jgi:very-short-patch-repair endonuclease